MNFFKTTFLLAFLFISFQSFSQDQLVKVNFIGLKYQYKGVKYREKMLPKLLKDNRRASKIYKSFKESKQIANVLGIGCITLAIIGRRKTKWNGDSYDISPILPFSMLPGTFGIVFNTIAKSKRRKAIRAFNANLEFAPDIGKVPIEMNFGLMANGIGVSLSF